MVGTSHALIWFLAVALIATPATAQPSVKQTVTTEQLREWADYASGAALGDEAKFHDDFKNLVRVLVPGYWRSAMELPFVVADDSDDFDIFVTGPLVTFHFTASQLARRMEPIGKLEVAPEVLVRLSVKTINAPDIDRILLRRGADLIVPLRSSLKPETVETRMGAKKLVHSGELAFPISAFAPGAEVTLIAMPVIGTNVIKRLTPDEMAKLTLGFEIK